MNAFVYKLAMDPRRRTATEFAQYASTRKVRINKTDIIDLKHGRLLTREKMEAIARALGIAPAFAHTLLNPVPDPLASVQALSAHLPEDRTPRTAAAAAPRADCVPSPTFAGQAEALGNARG